MSYPAIRSPIYFTKAKEEEKLWIEGKKKEKKKVLTGQEAKDFYQSLLQESCKGRPREACDVTTRRVKRGAGSDGFHLTLIRNMTNVIKYRLYFELSDC